MDPTFVLLAFLALINFAAAIVWIVVGADEYRSRAPGVVAGAHIVAGWVCFILMLAVAA